MNQYDHFDYRRDMERMEEARRESIAARREVVRQELPTPEAARLDGPWQLRFLVGVVIHAAFWGGLLWWLAGMPKLPIRWLQ